MARPVNLYSLDRDRQPDSVIENSVVERLEGEDLAECQRIVRVKIC